MIEILLNIQTLLNVIIMTKYIYVSLLVIILFVTACKNDNNNSDKTIVATVFDKTLYLEDIQSIMPDDATEKDSILIIKDRIELWVKKQAMLNMAEINLSDPQKDVDRIVKDYRASLLIDRYKQEFLKQKLDTTVSEKEIEDYFEMYSESFKLNQAIVKAEFYKFSVNYKDIVAFRNMFFSNKQENKDKAKEIAKNKASKYDFFNNKWVRFSEISSLLPSRLSNPEIILKSTNKIQTQDNDFYYFVRINDYKLKDNLEPLENISEQIKLIIINKRKVELINELEAVIYQNAQSHKNIKIFE